MFQRKVCDKDIFEEKEGVGSRPLVSIHTDGCFGRQRIERYISQKYLQVHDARVSEYLPLLGGIRDEDELVGAFGLRPGQYRPMFLEQYLDAPIEQQVASIVGGPVDRCALMEVGNLAITGKGIGPLAMVVLASSLADSGYEWMVFTVTEQVERLMKRLGFNPYYLAGANPNRLESDSSTWGSYYKNNPRVMVGCIQSASELINSNRNLSNIANQQMQSISNIADTLRGYRLGAKA